jgi:glycerophosphoryl diester phosphodiesterase
LTPPGGWPKGPARDWVVRMTGPRTFASLAITLLSTVLVAGGAPAASPRQGGPSNGSPKARPERPLVIAHRGASGYRPEHTLAAYALGARLGADYVEPDLVVTRDGVLVARHENEISGTTDVASHPEFAARRTTRTIDGVPITGWFTEDFTLAELRTLRARERIPALRPRNTAYDGRYRIPTFQEVIDLTRRLSRRLHRRIGIYPETKHPTYFRSIGLPLERRLIAALRRNGLDRRRSRVFVQSFEVSNLKALNRRIRVPLVQLLGTPATAPFDLAAGGASSTYADLASPGALRAIGRYADGVGPSKDYIVPLAASGASLPPTRFVRDAHRAGLVVHPYTFRRENAFLPLELRRGADPTAYGDLRAELRQFFELGVDGVFADQPEVAVRARRGAQ